MNIKYICSLALLTLSAATVFAQHAVEVTGLLKKNTTKPVKVFKVQEGQVIEIASTKATDKGNFGFKFYPEYEGFFLIGTGEAASPNDNYKFYFKGGEELSLTVLDSSYVLNGKLNSKENVVLSQWHNLVMPIEHKAVNFMKTQSTYVDFFPILEEIASKSKDFLKGKTTGNPRFDKQMVQNMAWDMAHYATNFLGTPRSAHPTVAQYSPYYATLKAANFARHTTGAYAQPWGMRILNGLVNTNRQQAGIKYGRGVEGLKPTLDFLPNDTLKGDFVLNAASGYTTFNDFKQLMDTYGKFILTKSQKKKQMDIMSPLALLKEGDAAFNFSYPDKEGKTVSMADLRGKVVLVDVWATWCGPCKAEIPHLKKLEEELKGTDVQVVSISVDEAKDKGKWLKMIKEEELGGLQLFASGWGDLAQYYKIKGIPRFMVFDKQGKIVTVDSPRPSDPALKVLLEKTLLN